MNNYKIKILCTSKDELCYNNKKISIKNYNKLKLEELINKNNIYKLLILYKKNKQNFTTKTLEFLCNEEMTEDNFQTFIKDMIDIGFSSKYNTVIQFIDNNKPNEPIYTYKFQSITKTNKKYKNKIPNNSTYYTQFLYKK